MQASNNNLAVYFGITIEYILISMATMIWEPKLYSPPQNKLFSSSLGLQQIFSGT